MDFVVSPPGYGRSVTNFGGWDAHEARLCCHDEVDGDIWIWSTLTTRPRGIRPQSIFARYIRFSQKQTVLPGTTLYFYRKHRLYLWITRWVVTLHRQTSVFLSHGATAPIFENSRLHSDTSHSVELPCTSDKPDTETSNNTQQTQETIINAHDGTRTRNPNQWAPANPRLRPRRYWA
jgi:hypothetical protein